MNKHLKLALITFVIVFLACMWLILSAKYGWWQ